MSPVCGIICCGLRWADLTKISVKLSIARRDRFRNRSADIRPNKNVFVLNRVTFICFGIAKHGYQVKWEHSKQSTHVNWLSSGTMNLYLWHKFLPNFPASHLSGWREKTWLAGRKQRLQVWFSQTIFTGSLAHCCIWQKLGWHLCWTGSHSTNSCQSDC